MCFLTGNKYLNIEHIEQSSHLESKKIKQEENVLNKINKWETNLHKRTFLEAFYAKIFEAQF